MHRCSTECNTLPYHSKMDQLQKRMSQFASIAILFNSVTEVKYKLNKINEGINSVRKSGSQKEQSPATVSHWEPTFGHTNANPNFGALTKCLGRVATSHLVGTRSRRWLKLMSRLMRMERKQRPPPTAEGTHWLPSTALRRRFSEHKKRCSSEILPQLRKEPNVRVGN